jgi:hypothetical protein
MTPSWLRLFAGHQVDSCTDSSAFASSTTTAGGLLGAVGPRVNQPEAKVIRVSDPHGRVEEDTIEASVGILIWEGRLDVSRASAELLGAEGQIIRSGPMRRGH